MKTKLNIFRIALVTFIVLYILALGFYVLATFTGGKTIPEVLVRTTVVSHKLDTNFYVYFCIDILKDVLLVYTLIQLLKISENFTTSNFFTPKTITLLKVIGLGFIGVSIIGFFNSILFHYAFSNQIIERLIFPTLFHFMTLIIGLGVLVIEETYNKGFVLKTENELTI